MKIKYYDAVGTSFGKRTKEKFHASVFHLVPVTNKQDKWVSNCSYVPGQRLYLRYSPMNETTNTRVGIVDQIHKRTQIIFKI